MVVAFEDDPNVVFADANMDESAHDGRVRMISAAALLAPP